MRKLIPVDGWKCNEKLPYRGKYRTDEGFAIFGFYKRVYKKNEEVLVINNGNLQGKYKYPKVEISFEAKMINWYNLCFCGGYWLKDIDGNDINTDDNLLNRVIEGKKPMGFLMATEDKVQTIAEKAMLNNLEVLINHDIFYEDENERLIEVGFANKGKLREHFDIEVIIEAYRLMSKQFGKNILETEEEIRLESMADKELIFFLKGFDYTNPVSNFDSILTGLILGLPLESTFAFMTR